MQVSEDRVRVDVEGPEQRRCRDIQRPAVAEAGTAGPGGPHRPPELDRHDG